MATDYMDKPQTMGPIFQQKISKRTAVLFFKTFKKNWNILEILNLSKYDLKLDWGSIRSCLKGSLKKNKSQNQIKSNLKIFSISSQINRQLTRQITTAKSFLSMQNVEFKIYNIHSFNKEITRNKKKHFFVMNVKLPLNPPSTPPPFVWQKPPTWKTLSEQLKKIF